MANKDSSSNLLPVGFHTIHGQNVQILRHRQRARYAIKDITQDGHFFTNRPVRINEKIFFQIEVDLSQKMTLGFGFTKKDPSTDSNLKNPKSSTFIFSTPGYWAKVLETSYCTKGNIISYYVNYKGEVNYSVNGEKKGLFTSGLDIQSPLWAAFYIFGVSTAIELVKPKNFEVTNLEQFVIPLKYKNQTVPLKIHPTVGRNILYINDTGVTRHYAEVNQGYIFTASPINIKEIIVIQILSTTAAYAGNLTFGFTTCNPCTLKPTDLPDNSDLIRNRSEFWTMLDYGEHVLHQGDELAITVAENGDVGLSENGGEPFVCLEIPVRNLSNLWMFVDVYGSTQKVRILSTQVTRVSQSIKPPVPKRTVSLRAPNEEDVTLTPEEAQWINQSQIPTQDWQASRTEDEHLRPVPSAPPLVEELDGLSISDPLHHQSDCTICFDQKIDCVLYKCGHMYMCYTCAMELWKGSGEGKCPVCRATIDNVIRTYKP